MFSLSADLQWASLEGLPEEVHAAIQEKMFDVTLLLYHKVMDNVSGFVLQKRSGALAGSIKIESSVSTDPMTGSVYVDPANAKAWVLEQGGVKNYVIEAKNAKFLHFFNKEGREIFTKQVYRTPGRAFRYLGLALDEVNVIQEFEEGLDAVL